MKSEPPTPTRAPDSQFRKMQDCLSYVRNTSLLNKTNGNDDIEVVMTRQLAEFNKYQLYPYQQSLKYMSTEYNDRMGLGSGVAMPSVGSRRHGERSAGRRGPGAARGPAFVHLTWRLVIFLRS